MELSVTICSWNTRKDLHACLASLGDAGGTPALQPNQKLELEVIVVDNASGDGSAEMVEAEFPEVRLIRSEVNLGFGLGHNLAFQHAKGDILMALNSDTVVHAGALRKIVDFMRANPESAIVGPKLLNPDGSLQLSSRRFPTPAAALFRNTPLGRLFPNNRFTREYLMTDWPHDEARDVDWVSGAALCIRREAYAEIGGFDDRFFMYLEDVDLCYRAWQAGFKVTYYPEAVITHAIGRSTDIVANKMIVQFHKSMMLFYRKHYLPKTNPIVRPFAIMAAALMLWARKLTLIAKNRLDDWKRRTGRL